MKIVLRADLNREDDDGLGWALVLAPTDPGSSARTPCCEQALRSSGHGCASPAWMKTVRSTSARSPQPKPRHRVNSPKRDDPLSPGVSTESRPSSMPKGRPARCRLGAMPFWQGLEPRADKSCLLAITRRCESTSGCKSPRGCSTVLDEDLVVWYRYGDV